MARTTSSRVLGMTSRILVTGAAGCIGRRICRALVAEGHDVSAVLRSQSSSTHLPAGVRIGWVGEIEPATRWPRELFAEVDAIIHLAAKVHAPRTEDSAESYRRTNVEATETLARAFAAAGTCGRFVYCSSVHAVCNFATDVVDEATACTPQTVYGRSKHDAELRLRKLAAATGLDVAIVRPAPVYGPELPGDLMKLLRLVARGWPLPLGAIDNRRSLVYVDNIVDALIRTALDPRAAGETFLVSDGDDVSLAELPRLYASALSRTPRSFSIAPRGIRLACSLFGKRATAERLLGSLAVDSGRIRRVLGWKPPHNLRSGLSATAHWMKSAA